MRRALFVPLPEPGHILPTLNVARYMISHGWEVVYFTAPQFGKIISSIAATVIPMIREHEGEVLSTGQRIWNQFAFDNEQGSRSRRLRHVLRDLIAQWQCSLILLDARLPIQFDSNINDVMDEKRLLLFSSSLPEWNEYKSRKMRVPLMIFCPEEFEIPKFRYPCLNCHYVEPSLRLQHTGSVDFEAFSRLRAGHPLILASFGTQAIRDTRLRIQVAMIRELALRRSDLDFIVDSPSLEGIASDEGWIIPTNFQIVSGVPQRAMLERSQVFITHGGLGSIKEAITAGVPMMVLPSLFDQPFNAMRVRFHGLGGAIFPERQNLDAFDSVLTSALRGDYGHNLEAMQTRFVAAEEAQPSRKLLASYM